MSFYSAIKRAQRVLDAGPTVSPVANGQVNSVLSGTCYAGNSFNSSGAENEVTASTGAYNISLGNWLDDGSPGDVWVERTVTAGSWNSSDPGTGRHQLNTSRNWRVIRVATGIQTVTGSFEMFNAASGGDSLATTSSATWSAENDFDPCPLCCFTPETPVQLASGLVLPISKVRKGDLVLVYDPHNNEQFAQEVTGIITRVNRTMYRVTFVGGHFVDLSDDHPLEVEGKGPHAVYPIYEYKDIGIPDKLAVGDEISGAIPGVQYVIESIEPISYRGVVYTLENSLFYAGGLLVY